MPTTDATDALQHCPFCGAAAKRVWYDERWRTDWECGSFLHGDEPYQFSNPGCEVKVLEASYEALRKDLNHFQNWHDKVKLTLGDALAESARLRIWLKRIACLKNVTDNSLARDMAVIAQRALDGEEPGDDNG